MIAATARLDLHEILVRIALSTQLTPTKHDLASQRYEALGRALCERGSPFAGLAPTVFPQGSMRIGTTVKPLPRAEFDLDLVCHLTRLDPSVTATEIFRELRRFLEQHPDYRHMVRARPRCMRLVYHDDFHLDVLVARTGAGAPLQVPDRDLGEWLDTDPIGFAEWFWQRCKLVRVEETATARASIEPVPSRQELAEKYPLQVAVQVLKRARDLHFEDKPALAPSSILLTTLIAGVYQGDPDAGSTIRGVLSRLREWVTACTDVPVVTHPTSPSEVLSRPWQERPEAFRAFCGWLAALENVWNRLDAAVGLPRISERLTEFLGSAPVQAAIREFSTNVRETVGSGAARLTIGTAIALAPQAGSRSILVPRHTFYGEL